jgi:hypothetical protein
VTSDPGFDHQTPMADDAASGDRLATLRDELDAIDEVPVVDRVALFERANAVIAAELARLDEV